MNRSHPHPWSAGQLLVVLDIGKTNAKLVLLDPLTGVELASRSRPNASVPGPLRQLDVEGLGAWLVEALSALPERHRIGAIVPVAHGASCVMLAADGTPVLAPDYEDPVLDTHRDAYDRLRDGFDRILSPSLPAGLNLGRQIDFVQRHLPAHFARVTTILTYPQYWAYVLCGIAASEITSLGCHTDLWLPTEGRFSLLAERQGWAALFPPLRPAGAVLGRLHPGLAARSGLPPDCMVLCGIHDSNASYLRHRMRRPVADPFSVVSSGTWTVVLANAVAACVLEPARDMLANVDAFGALVGTARFMGGREYLAVAGPDAPVPTMAGLVRALDAGARVLPGFAAGGQFIGHTGRIIGAETLDRAARAALATLYIALLTDVALDLLRAAGDIVIDGPLGRNPLYPGLLAAFRPYSAVLLGDETAGSVGGARCLLLGGAARFPDLRRVAAPAGADRLRAERTAWLAALRRSALPGPSSMPP